MAQLFRPSVLLPLKPFMNRPADHRGARLVSLFLSLPPPPGLRRDKWSYFSAALKSAISGPWL
jgi:hypothetical protein